MRKLLAKFQRKTPPPLLLLKGEEPYFRYAIIKDLKAFFRRSGYEIEDLDVTSMPEADILDALDSPSFTATHKLVVIRNIEKVKGKKSKLAEVIQTPLDNTILILESNTDGDNVVTQAVATVKDAVTFVSTPFKPFSGDIDKWLQEEAAYRGYSLSPEQARLIHHNVGHDLFALQNELRKLLMHCDGRAVTDNDLRAILTRTSGSQTFELTSAVGEKSFKRAMTVLDQFYRTEDDPALLLCASLIGYIEKLIRAKSLLEYGLDKKDAAQVLGMHPFAFQKNLEPHLKKHESSALMDMYNALCTIDIQLKGSSLNGRTLLESFLAQHLPS